MASCRDKGATVLLAGVIAVAAGLFAAVRETRKRRPTEFRGKVVVITGGSRGLGLALAEELGRLGAKRVLAARDAEELDRARDLLVQRCALLPEHILTVISDLRKPDHATELVRRATDAYGRVDILVSNAGIITVGPVEHQTYESFRDVMNTNFFSTVDCSLAVLPQTLARRSGIIVNIASLGGKVAVPHMLPYTSSKFAVVGFSQGLHAELRSKGIHVLTVCPGLMRTGSHLHTLFSGDAPREYQWFSLLSNMPGLSVSARHAAKRIVRAIVWREAEIAISPQAALAGRLAQAMPALSARAMCAVNGALPDAAGGSEQIVQGLDARERELLPATVMSTNAVLRYNQIG